MPLPHRPLAAIALCAVLAACQPAAPVADAGPPSVTAPAPQSAGLAGSTWRLVEMQSMDDAQGTTRPADPARYTVSFGADGRAAFQLDCNRGSASWTADANALTFGPVASTRMLCPQPSLGPRLASQLGFVRSYLIRDGRLAMSLMADGGIIVWEPAPQP